MSFVILVITDYFGGTLIRSWRFGGILKRIGNEYYTVEPKRMNISGARNPIRTEPNQALQRIATLVTVHAPSRMNRAKRVYR